MSVLFDSGPKMGLIVNPDEEFVTITFDPHNMEVFRKIFREAFCVEEGAYFWTPCGEVDLIKVLKKDDEGFHVRLYSNSFPSKPTALDASSLFFSKDQVSGRRGIGHIPISKERFFAWGPTHVANGEVSEEELDGYRQWKDDSGGYFKSKPNKRAGSVC